MRGRRASESERVTDGIGEKERERWRWIHILTGVREKWEHITKGKKRESKNGVTGGSRERIMTSYRVNRSQSPIGPPPPPNTPRPTYTLMNTF